MNVSTKTRQENRILREMRFGAAPWALDHFWFNYSTASRLWLLNDSPSDLKPGTPLTQPTRRAYAFVLHEKDTSTSNR